MNTPETRVLQTKLEKKIAEGLIEWIHYLKPSEIKLNRFIKTEISLVPERGEYALLHLDDDIEVWVGYNLWAIYNLEGLYKTKIKIGEERTYQLDVCADFVRLFETDDALFAYTGILAQNRKIFGDNIGALLNESFVTRMAEFMMRSGKNPYGYLQFIEHLYSFLNSGEEINAKVLSGTKELLDRLTDADDSQKYSFQPLSSRLLVKSYLENTMHVLAEKLGVLNQFKSFNVDLSEDDTLDLTIKVGLKSPLTLASLPKKWSEAFLSEDEFVALIVYALLWNQEVSKKNGLWGPDSIEKLRSQGRGYSPGHGHEKAFRLGLSAWLQSQRIF